MSRTIQEIMNSAPKGSTHWSPYNDAFYLLDGFKYRYFIYDRDEWSIGEVEAPPSWIEQLVPVKEHYKPWSGPEDGLPPVGIECEFSDILVTVIAHVDQPDCREEEYKTLAVGQKGNRGQIVMGPSRCFKPTKTEEQQAVDNRETAIRELMDIAQVDCRVTAARLVDARLVDAGFKR